MSGRRRPALRAALIVAVVVSSGCTSASTSVDHSTPHASVSSPDSATPSGTAASGTRATGSQKTVWLCRPGPVEDPCTSDLSTTTITPSGARAVEHASPAAAAPIDCFYVYPTVSNQRTPNANLHVDPEETAVAIAQASRFSQVCRVYAPMYPQLTRSAVGSGGSTISPQAALTAFAGVVTAWQDYLAHDNRGRGVVLIGHSQGAFLLDALLRTQVDSVPAVRARLVSAILLGGNVTVAKGTGIGGDFAHIPACTSGRQTGCVIAYSSFASRPPANSLFGRVGTSIAAGLGGGSSVGSQVLCTNPATLDGGRGSLRPYLPVRPVPALGGERVAPADVTTAWVSYPGEYTASCRTVGGATWLQIHARGTAARRPILAAPLGPRWGLHLVDVNIALGNLVAVVARQAKAYRG